MMSRLLVAYTMEFDNEVERRLPHRTSRGPAAGREGVPWLISQPMWANFLDLLDDPAPLSSLPAELVNVGGLQRWGYITVGPGPDGVVTLTPNGVAAQRIFREVSSSTDARWTDRFGIGVATASAPADPALPRHLPMSTVSRPAVSTLPRFISPISRSGAGVPMRARTAIPTSPDAATRNASGAAVSGVSEVATRNVRDPAVAIASPVGAGSDSPLAAGGQDAPLSTLLAQELMRFTAALGARSRIPMGLGSNVLRVLASGACRTRDLPVLAGISREAADGSLKALLRAEAVTLSDGSATLTEHGQSTWQAYHEALTEVDGQWRDARPAWGTALEATLGQHDKLVEAVTPHPEGWRAHPPYARLTRTMLENPAANLPAYPMVSHRGGFPDGS